MIFFSILKVELSVWRLPVLLLCSGLGGCASVADGLNGASLIGGMVSVELTGKGLTDHAVSLASGQDCSFLRLFHRTEVCRPWVEIQSVDGNPVVTESAQSGEEYIVIGRFGDYHKAMTEARALQDFRAHIAAWHSSTSMYEVRLGPYTQNKSEEVQTALKASGTLRFAVVPANEATNLTHRAYADNRRVPTYQKSAKTSRAHASVNSTGVPN